MTKTQKIWLWIFIAMFALPEILWSPILNFYYELSQSNKTSFIKPLRDNFLQNTDNLNILKLIIFLQLIGLLLILVSLIRNKEIKSKIIKYFLIILLIILFIIVGFVFYFASIFSVDIL
jgi:hypothetical protein